MTDMTDMTETDLWRAAALTAQDTIQRVLNHHTEGVYPDLPYPICEQCSEDRGYQWWPCPTVAAIYPPDAPGCVDGCAT